jgi:hypothetical protein
LDPGIDGDVVAQYRRLADDHIVGVNEVDVVAKRGVRKDIAAANALAFMSRYTTDIPLGGTDNDIGKHAATGLERVPYDGFPAILHKDEMVLDRKDANAYRNGDAPGPSKGGVTVIQNIQSVPQTASELAFQTMNALEMLRFSV